MPDPRIHNFRYNQLTAKFAWPWLSEFSRVVPRSFTLRRWSVFTGRMYHSNGKNGPGLCSRQSFIHAVGQESYKVCGVRVRREPEIHVPYVQAVLAHEHVPACCFGSSVDLVVQTLFLFLLYVVSVSYTHLRAHETG